MEPVYARIAGIDVHKRMLAVVIASAEHADQILQRRKFGTTVADLMHLTAWLSQHQVDVAVMESTAQYWKPVWAALEPHLRLHLAQAQSNRGPRGRKTDFQDAARLVRRWVAGELILSYVPDAEQRQWRQLTRTRGEYARQRAALHSHIEALLVEAQIQLAAVISDLLGGSGRRILQALAQGESDPEKLAGLGDPRLRVSPQRLQEALQGRLSESARLILRQYLERIEGLDRHIGELEQELSAALNAHQAALARLCQMPGVGLVGACQIVAEVGPRAAAFPSPEQLASWVGVCPGREESAGQPHSQRSPKGNRAMRRVLCQIAWAAVRTKGSHFQALFRRWIPRLGIRKALWAVAHRILRVIWRVLHQQVDYQEFGVLRNSPKELDRRKRRLLAQLRGMGYAVSLTPLPQAPLP